MSLHPILGLKVPYAWQAKSWTRLEPRGALPQLCNAKVAVMGTLKSCEQSVHNNEVVVSSLCTTMSLSVLRALCKKEVKSRHTAAKGCNQHMSSQWICMSTFASTA